ncbi:MAG: FG-GAP repeat domain-containing protein [Roseobacter sp.]
MIGALRLLFCASGAVMRSALLVLCTGQAVFAQEITAATYQGPTTRYAHAVLGDAVEYGALAVTLSSGQTRRFKLPVTSVFEDVAPRVIDLDGDGAAEVITVESDQSLGARLAIYGPTGLITATPYIGTRFRWLAPLGAADLDGDGVVELAYVDRPHLAKTLRIWRYQDQTLVPLLSAPGFTNHRIGEADIAGGIRVCDGKAEMILATANWSSLVALQVKDDALTQRVLGSDTTRAAFAKAMVCVE